MFLEKIKKIFTFLDANNGDIRKAMILVEKINSLEKEIQKFIRKRIGRKKKIF